VSKPRILTAADDELLRQEAIRRAEMRTNKQIARLLCNRVSPEYAGKRIAVFRREYESNHPHEDDSRGTEMPNSSGIIRG
jgi:hypothetical protein